MFSGFSQKICLECKEKAIAAYKFRQMCISSDESVRLNRKPTMMNNEHDYSLYINDEYDMDFVSKYLIDTTKEAPPDMLMERANIVEEKLVLDDTQNFDASAVKSKSRRYACPVCDRLWVTPSKLERHMTVHRKLREMKEQQQPKEELKDPVVQCPLCCEQFESQQNLQDHMKTHQRVTEAIPTAEKIGKTYICTVCDCQFLSPAKLTNHMKTHIRKVSIMKTRGEGKTPEKMKTGRQHHPHKCPTCSKCFPHPSKLQRHMTTHGPLKKEKNLPKPRNHECILCSKKFETPSKLQRHEASAVHRNMLQDMMKSESGIETPTVLEISTVTSILGD